MFEPTFYTACYDLLVSTGNTSADEGISAHSFLTLRTVWVLKNGAFQGI